MPIIWISNQLAENVIQSGRSCHKSWLSKADFTWLILMSHKVCWILHYDVAWLIVLTLLRTRKSFLYYDWLIVSWLTIVTSYHVMTFAHDSYYESWVSRMWLVRAHDLVYGFWLVNRMLCDDSYESLMDFALWLTTGHRGLCSTRWWVTRVRVVGRRLYKALGWDQGIGHEPLQQHLQRLKSQHHEKSSSLSPTHLSSPTMATA